MPELLARVRRYYDAIYIDEIQDFGGYDFNFVLALCSADVSILLIGDFFQHTYSTSVDGKVNEGLHSDYEKYKQRFEAVGIKPNEGLLEKSRRCSKEICELISNGMGIKIESQAEHSSKIVVVENDNEIERLHACKKTVKLFYEEHGLYNCFSDNWGASKGVDHYQDVLVVLNDKSWKAYKKREWKSLKPLTRNKLYVACSRTRGDLYLATETSFKRFRSQD